MTYSCRIDCVIMIRGAMWWICKHTPGATAGVRRKMRTAIRAADNHVILQEAVQAMSEWALEQENVSHIIAETDIDGIASQRILQRCIFISL